MTFELLHTPFPDDYTETLLPLDLCKLHLSVEAADDDMLIEALRDAAIEFVESYCGVRLAPMMDLVWVGEAFPATRGEGLDMCTRPVTAISAISWADTSANPVVGAIGDFRVTTRGLLLPAISLAWPSSVGGDIAITFDAGFEEGAAPQVLLQAARMLLGYFWLNREEIVSSGMSGEAPFGVLALCRSFRRVLL